ncbi:MAG TPA: carbohydrate-binding family 9-like protein [Panacibacter sp.]|nr:carbohydrate-binding family 9-like protein [Panacibacter sp.]
MSVKKNLCNFCTASFALLFAPTVIFAQQNAGIIKVKSTPDFTITGNGNSVNWNNTEWNIIQQRDSKTLRNNNWNIPRQQDAKEDLQYKTSFKILYSGKGIYCLYKCEDSTITATLKGDYLNLYDEDVVEAFLWPDTTLPVYFEYELSPLNFELPILILNNKGNMMGWQPWQYEGERKTIHAISINEKNKKDNRFTWTAEFFIPFSLLSPLSNVPPVKGTKWRANFYRIDYDRNPVYSSWQLTRNSFHDPQKFGTLEFE